jgi:tRNA G10  N-methylase Trm11
MTFFLLGNHTDLAIAEMAAVIGRDLDYSTIRNQILLLDEHRNDLGTLQERLAGVIKSGWITAELPNWDDEQLKDLILAGLADVQSDRKINFGISIYDRTASKVEKELKKQSERLGLTVKKQLRAEEKSVRYVSSKEADLSSVILIENNVLTSGAEFVIIKTEDGFLFGQTATVQNYKAWSERDFGRPARDAKSGMLPPKLARTMINLAGRDLDDAVLLDPFCGSGTVLMEAALMGCTQLIGSDISEKAIEDTTTNMAWVTKHYLETEPTLSLIETPAQELTDHRTEPVNLIIAETYLGPPRKGNESPKALKDVASDILTLNREAFTTLYDLLTPGGTCVVAFPVYLTDKNPLHLPLKKMLEEIGYTIKDPLPTSFANENKKTPSGGLLYERAHQLVAREILVFTK